MAEAPIPDSPQKLQEQPGSFREHFVPMEQRESQNVKPTPFIQNYAVILGLTGLGAVAGFFTGKALEPRNIKLGKLASYKFGTDRVNRQAGLIAGAEVGGLWGLFHHWRKAEGKQLGIQSLSTDLRTALDPAQLEKEAQKEEALVRDMKLLEERLAAGSGRGHGGSVTARREENASGKGLGA